MVTCTVWLVTLGLKVSVPLADWLRSLQPPPLDVA
jgi:hypothetical protein